MKSREVLDSFLTYLGKPLDEFAPTADATRPPLQLEGPMVLKRQEGGFAGDAILVNDQGLAEVIKEHFSTKQHNAMGDTHVAFVRLTVEVVHSDPVEAERQ